MSAVRFMLHVVSMAFAECQIKKVGGLAHTYLMVCITECLGLLIRSVRIDRILVVKIGGVRLCGLIFLVVRGSMVRLARRFASCLVAWFALEGHDVVGINGLGRRARSMSRSMCGRRCFGDKGVEHGRGNLVLALGHRGSHCWGHGLIIVRVLEPDDLQRIQEFAIRAYITIVRCHGKLRVLKARASLCTFYTLFDCPNNLHCQRLYARGRRKVHATHRASWIRREAKVQHGRGRASQDGGREYRKYLRGGAGVDIGRSGHEEGQENKRCAEGA